jgi:O-antigen/teichoic acid export membrane protein
MALGIATFAGPYTVSLFTDSLGPIISTLLISRAVGLLLFRRFAQRCLQREHDPPDPSMKSSTSPAVIRQLLTFGGWLTVSSVVYPIMMQADRFIIGGTISASAVAGYTIPYEVVLQTLVLVGAITTVAFPRLTSLLTDNPKESLNLFYRWLAYSVGLMATVGSALAASFPIILPLWIGNQLPGEAILVGQILCFGLVPYTIGTMYLAIIHACGRPDVTAKAHLLEAPLYFLLLFAMIQQYGLTGAAWAWNIRATIDAVMLVIWFEIKEKPSLT